MALVLSYMYAIRENMEVKFGKPLQGVFSKFPKIFTKPFSSHYLTFHLPTKAIKDESQCVISNLMKICFKFHNK